MKLWIWRAWSSGHERMCDCGTAWAKTSADAEAIGWMSVGGPWRDEIAMIEVEPIRAPAAPYAQVSA